MSATPTPPRRFTVLDRAILAVHLLLAIVFGVYGLVDASDAASLQRLVVLILLALWVGGIVIMGVVARFISIRWLRTMVLLVGPFLGIAVLVVAARLA
jgi:hypothetical protein